MPLSRAIAVTKIPETVSGRITGCLDIKSSMTDNPIFKTPSPTMVEFGAAIQAAIDAQTELDSRKVVGTAKRDDAVNAMMRECIRLTAYVQAIADANPATSASIIESAGMYVKSSGGKKAQVYEVTSEETGVIVLSIPADSRKQPKHPIIWETSLDGVAWKIFKVSRLSMCEVSKLPSGELWYFRYCLVDDNNENTPYSEVTTCRIK